MELENLTPFHAFSFEAEMCGDLPVRVVVVSATFKFDSSGDCTVAETQVPVVLAPEFYTGIFGTGLKRDNDLAPIKPGSDLVLVEPVAMSPDGRPTQEWSVWIECGGVRHSMVVTGERWWRKRLLGWSLKEPLYATLVPLTYNHAYGGFSGDRRSTFPWDELNPTGCGRFTEKELKESKLRAPQVMAPGQTLLLNSPIEPVGVCPIPRGWMPRRSLAGTFDETWKQTRWPRMPLDFDMQFYLSAHPAFQLKRFWESGEVIRLHGIGSPGLRHVVLPNMEMVTLTRRESSPGEYVGMNRDTVEIDPGRNQIRCIWRTQLTDPDGIRSLVVAACAEE